MALDPLFPLVDDWEVLPLADACARGGGNIQTGPFGSQLHAADYVPRGIPSVMPQNITSDRISTEGIARISEHDASRLSKYRLKTGDIIYSRRGDVERRALVQSEHEGWLCGTGCLRVRLGNGVVHPQYAAFYLSHQAARDWVVQHAVGATMPNLNTSILGALPFVLPPLDRQHEIAAVLSALDDKIELNRRMNETLEGMAQAIFKDWFVDFGPTRRKLAGIADPVAIMGGLTPDAPRATELAALFPDALGEDGLPAGWSEKTLAEICEINPREPMKKGQLAPYSGMASLPTNGPTADVPILREFGSGMRFKNGDALLARITPCLENGKSAFVDFLSDGQVGWGSTEFIVLRANPPIPAPFSYLIVRHPEFRSHAIQSMTGTSGRQRAQEQSIGQFTICYANEAIYRALGEYLAPFFEKITANAGENRLLAETRDYLLPKLMSGEVRVRDVEKREA